MPTTPTIVSHSVIAGSVSQSNPSYTLPGGILAGDLLLVFPSYGGSTAITAGPSGWTRLESVTLTTIGLQECWAKSALGTESGASITFTGSPGRVWFAEIVQVRGGPVSLGALQHRSGAVGAGSAPPSVSVTALIDNSLIIQSLRANSTSSSPLTVPSGWTSLDAAINAGGSTPGAYVAATKVQAVNGATGTALWGSSASSNYTLVTVAIPDGSVNQRPTLVAAPTDIMVEVGTPVTMGVTSTDADGTVVSYACTPETTGTTRVAPSVTIVDNHDGTATGTLTPRVAGAYTFNWTCTDNLGGVSPVALVRLLVAGTETSWSQTSVLRVRRSGSWDDVTV